MLRSKAVRGLAVLTVCLWSAGGAQGRDLFQNAKFDVFVLGGGSTLVDPQYFTSAGNRFHSRFDLGYKFTVGVSVPYGKFLNIESGYTYGPNNLVVTNTSIFPHAGILYPVRFHMGTLSGVVHTPSSIFGITPYVAGGVEYDQFSPTPDAVRTATDVGFGAVSTFPYLSHNDKFGVNLGGGFNRKLTKRISFRVDLRDHVTSSPAFGIPTSRAEFSSTGFPTFPVKGRANNIIYEAGFVFHLGKK